MRGKLLPRPSAVRAGDGAIALEKPCRIVREMVSDRAGAQLLAGGEELVLASEILELNVTEGERFEARVSLRLSLFYGQQPVWTHIYLGTGSQWGRDHDPDQFNEAISEALDKIMPKRDLLSCSKTSK